MEKKPYVYFHSHPTKCLNFPLLRRQTKNDNSIRLTVINRNHRWNTVILTTNSKTEILINNTNFYLSLLQIHYYTGDFKIFCWLWRRQWHPTPVLLPGKSHGRRSLVGAVHGVTKSRTRLHFHFHFPLSCIGEGNGNPLQCSCLENPGDGEAWWAAVYGVAQSRTRLKWLSIA